MLGLAVVGAMVGLAGRLLHPAGRVVTLPAALWLGALGAWAFFTPAARPISSPMGNFLVGARPSSAPRCLWRRGAFCARAGNG